MSPSDIVRALTALVPTRRPVFLWSPPGCGKSSVVRHVADALKVELVDIRATLLDPVDIRGLPKVSGDVATWCPPAFLPRGGAGILFLDELGQAVPLVQAALLSLTLERKVGEYTLPEGWSIVAASNRAEDRAGTHRIISPLMNRFVHLDLLVSPEDWQDWAAAAGVAPEVRAFIRFKPKLLFDFDPSTNPRAFPTPRSWHFVSDVLPVTPKALLHRVVAGCVGEGPAAEFYGFLELYKSLPDVDAVLASPSSAIVPKEPSVLCALVGALVEKVRADKAKAPAFVSYSGRLPEEYAMLALRDALAIDRTLVAHPAVGQWVAAARSKGMFAGLAS